MFRWNLMVRTRFGSHRQETKARRLRKTVRLRLEALEDRTLSSASSLPVVTVASPPAAPQVAAITSVVDSMVQRQLQVIDMIVQDASNIWSTLDQEMVQEVAGLQLQVGRILGINPNTPNPSSNAAVPQSNSDSGAGQNHASGSGGGSGAMTPAHEHPHPRLDASADVSGTGTASGSGPYSGSATVTGKVWLDNNGNGSQDQSNVEMDYAGDTVSLFVSTDGGSTWSFKSSTPTSDATQGYNYSLKVAYGYPWPSSYLYKIQVGIPANFEATNPGTSQIDAQGFSQVFSLPEGAVQIIIGGLASMTVNTTDDDPNGPLPADQNKVTLRDAMQTGNNGGGILGLTNISFFSQGNPLSGTISLEKALDSISRSYNISGPGASTLTVQGQGVNGANLFRIFTVNAGVTSTISGLTIQDGYVQNGNGGGIFNSGNLWLTQDTINSNGATGTGGGIYNGVNGDMTIEESTISNNYTSDGDSGGGIYNAGTLEIYTSKLYHNFIMVNNNTIGSGGGLFNASGAKAKILEASSINNNVSTYYGGGVANSGTLTITSASISKNNSGTGSGGGGGIFSLSGSLTLTTRDKIVKNQALAGGGIYIGGGAAKMTKGSISSNSADGSIFGDMGGGVYVTGGTLTLTKVRVTFNKVTTGAGGGLAVGTNAGNVTVSGGTFDFNSTKGASDGGGIYTNASALTLKGGAYIGPQNSANEGGGMYLAAKSTTTFNGVTVAGNIASKGGAGVYQEKGAIVNPNPPVPPALSDKDDPGGTPVTGA